MPSYDEAEEEYREAIRLNPDYAGAHNNLGYMLLKLERYDEAEKECRKAVKLDSDNADFHDSIGELFSKTKRPEEAKKEFEIAKSLFAKQGRDEGVKLVEELLKDLESL